MLKKDVVKYLGFEDDRVRGDIKISSLLDISQSAVTMWGELVPRRRAKALHDMFRVKRFIRKFPLSEETPVFDAKVYEKAYAEDLRKRELKKLEELKAKYEV